MLPGTFPAAGEKSVNTCKSPCSLPALLTPRERYLRRGSHPQPRSGQCRGAWRLGGTGPRRSQKHLRCLGSGERVRRRCLLGSRMASETHRWGNATAGLLWAVGQPWAKLVPVTAWQQPPALAGARANAARGHPGPACHLHLLHRGEQSQPQAA